MLGLDFQKDGQGEEIRRCLWPLACLYRQSKYRYTQYNIAFSPPSPSLSLLVSSSVLHPSSHLPLLLEGLYLYPWSFPFGSYGSATLTHTHKDKTWTTTSPVRLKGIPARLSPPSAVPFRPLTNSGDQVVEAHRSSTHATKHWHGQDYYAIVQNQDPDNLGRHRAVPSDDNESRPTSVDHSTSYCLQTKTTTQLLHAVVQYFVVTP